MGLLKTSLRTIRKRKSRAALTIICITIGVAVFAGANVGADGVENAYITQLLSTFSDVDLTLSNSSNPLYSISYNSSLITQILNTPHVEAAAPRISTLQTFWFNGTGDNVLILLGIDVILDSEFGLVNPADLINQLQGNNCIINQVAAEMFNLTPGQIIGLYSPVIGVNETVQIIGVGVFQGKFSIEKSAPLIVFNIEFIQSLLHMESQATELVLKIDSYRNIDAVINNLRNLYGDKFTYYSQKLEALDKSSSNIMVLRGALNIFSILALIVTFVLIIVVMLMNISERKRDLGIMRAIGASTKQIFTYVIVETLIYGLIGSTTGTIAGILLSTYMLDFLGAAISTLTSLGELTIILNPLTLITCFSTGMLIVLLAGNIPAVAATKITILETIRPRMKGVAKVNVIKKTFILGVVLLISGSLTMYLLGGGMIITGNFTPILLSTTLITAGLILSFNSTLYYISKGVSTFFKLFLKESKSIIERNVARNRTRTTFTFTMVAIGIVFVIFFSSLAVTFTATFSTVIRVFTGSDIKMQVSPSINYNFTSELRTLPGVQNASPSYESLCTINGQDFKIALIFTDPESFLTVYPRINTASGPTIEEALNTLKSTNRTIILAKKAADLLNLTVGDNIALNVKNVNGSTTTMVFKIVALVEQFYGYPQYMFNIRAFGDIYGAYISISQLQEIVGTSNVETFFIKTRAGVDQIQVKKDLENVLSRRFESVTLISAKEWENQISSIVESFSNVVYFFVGFAFIVATIGIGIIMIVAVSERRREIGILKAIGMSRNQVLKLVLGESVIITVIGLIVGIGGGLYLWFLFLNRVSSTVSNLFFELPFIIPVEVIVYMSVVGLIMALTAAAYPAYRAMELEIVDALRRD
ncbi:MAG: FtsX-like permease family protein [Candidatus Odinarchaeum yellowstonii]|uniref:FtsX-like permease family protein n=1 Tax=Odinarchaeota yellowstonii (strain LCB_4) TaxID=1841599 RepID=A0AAF0D2W0_ODILC|nr:MAG: FtsX-like permease family protein [Candidatus Odinarchaeum yellowstonii]